MNNVSNLVGKDGMRAATRHSYEKYACKLSRKLRIWFMHSKIQSGKLVRKFLQLISTFLSNTKTLAAANDKYMCEIAVARSDYSVVFETLSASFSIKL